MLPSLRALTVASGRYHAGFPSRAQKWRLVRGCGAQGGMPSCPGSMRERDMRQKILAAVLLVGVAVALGWYFLWDGTQGSLVLYGNVEIR